MATNDHTTKSIPTTNAEFADWAHAQIEEWRNTDPKGLRDALIATIEADPAAYEQAYDEDVRSRELKRAQTIVTQVFRGAPNPTRHNLMLTAVILTEDIPFGNEAQTTFVKRLLGIEEPAAEEDALVAAVAALATAEQDVDSLRTDRDQLIRQAHASGARQVDLAEVAGISQQAIAKIVKTVPAPVEHTPKVEARITTISGAVFTGPTLRAVLDAEWGKLAKISGQFGRLAVTVPLDGGIAKLAEVQSYEVSDEDRLRAWERKHRVMGSELAGGEVQAARARFAEDGALPEDAPNASELWLIQ